MILYNDAPAAVPAADSRLDYYTGDLDQTDTGGTVSTLPGYGPNTRTIMAFGSRARPVRTDGALQPELRSWTLFTGTLPCTRRLRAGQDPIIVPQAPYDSA